VGVGVHDIGELPEDVVVADAVVFCGVAVEDTVMSLASSPAIEFSVVEALGEPICSSSSMTYLFVFSLDPDPAQTRLVKLTV
jgi:hypothetical protein